MKTNFFVNFFAAIVSFFKNLFHKEKAPTRRQILSKQYAELSNENQLLFEVQEALKADWRDPYTFAKVSELVKQIRCDRNRYPGAENLHNLANGLFYYYDSKHQLHEVPYGKMSDEYYHFQKNGGVPKDLLDIKYFPAIYEYIPAMQSVWKRMEVIKEHVKIRKEKNDQQMDEILKEYYAPIAA